MRHVRQFHRHDDGRYRQIGLFVRHEKEVCQEQKKGEVELTSGREFVDHYVRRSILPHAANSIMKWQVSIADATDVGKLENPAKKIMQNDPAVGG